MALELQRPHHSQDLAHFPVTNRLRPRFCSLRDSWLLLPMCVGDGLSAKLTAFIDSTWAREWIWYLCDPVTHNLSFLSSFFSLIFTFFFPSIRHFPFVFFSFPPFFCCFSLIPIYFFISFFPMRAVRFYSPLTFSFSFFFHFLFFFLLWYSLYILCNSFSIFSPCCLFLSSSLSSCFIYLISREFFFCSHISSINHLEMCLLFRTQFLLPHFHLQ